MLCNISVGDAARYGTFYHRNVTAGVTMENIYTTDTLYVGSRFVDEEGRIHFSVTNDTAQERKLMIVTPRQTIILPVKACPPYEDRTADMTFEDFPFDIDVVVPGHSGRYAMTSRTGAHRSHCMRKGRDDYDGSTVYMPVVQR